MRHVVIGIGEVGTGVLNVLVGAGYKVDTIDLVDSMAEPRVYDVLHICIPYSDSFVDEVVTYKEQHRAKVVIIYSTVPIGTTKKIDGAVHSPVEGRHPRLTYGVKTFKRYIGYNDINDGKVAERIWRDITETQLVENSDATEFLKLASTSKYGINLVWAQYMDDTMRKLGLGYELVKDWDLSYNELYARMKLPKFKKYVLDSPKGKIGGHCVVPNAALLDEQYPNDMLKMIKEMR